MILTIVLLALLAPKDPACLNVPPTGRADRSKLELGRFKGIYLNCRPEWIDGSPLPPHFSNEKVNPNTKEN